MRIQKQLEEIGHGHDSDLIQLTTELQECYDWAVENEMSKADIYEEVISIGYEPEFMKRMLTTMYLDDTFFSSMSHLKSKKS
jgi:hypothetical protein